MTIQTFVAGQTLTASQMNTLQASDFNHTRNVQSGASYTLVATDVGKLIEFTNNGSIVFTIPPNSSIAFNVGDRIDVLLASTGDVTVTPGSGVTVNAEGGLLTISSQWSKFSVIKRETDSWVVTGAGMQVQTTEIENLAVTAAKIASDAVTTAKILDSNVTTAKIADSAITSAKIADGAIVNADISTTAAIDLGKLADATIDEKSADYTLALNDKNKFIKMSVTSTANTVTVPTNASVAFPIGSQIHIIQYGTGKTQVIPVSGTVILYATPGAYLRAQYSSATLLKCDTNIWMLMGDLSAS